jgi:RNA polymerase sigma-70 factor (ECF subfamily)
MTQPRAHIDQELANDRGWYGSTGLRDLWQTGAVRNAAGTPKKVTRFDTTHWSVVLRARSGPEDARAALETLCRTYRPPVLAYIRGRGYPPEQAEDLAQSFFTRFLENAYHADADPARGRFRAFLLTALKRFLINSDMENHALKRGGGMHFDPLSSDSGEAPVAATASPEAEFERSWAVAVLDAAMNRLREEAERAGKVALFEQLQEFLTERPDEADYARAAAALNLRRNTLAVAVHRMRHRLRELVREELAQTTVDREDLESELRGLRAALGAAMH